LTEKGKQVETVLDQFGLKHLQSRGHTFSDSETRASCVVQQSSPYESKSAAPLAGCCEFATGIFFEASENRTCAVTKCFCPATVFTDPKIYPVCSIRKEKLLEQT
jgi:hypothetical protein